MNAIINSDLENLKTYKAFLMENCTFMLKVQCNDFDQVICPLILTSLIGKIEPFQYLVENFEVDINQRSIDLGFTALAVATHFANYNILKGLLEYGADPNIPLKNGASPLYLALGRLKEKKNPLENKIIGLKMATLLLDYGAEIDGVVNIKTGNTMLLELFSEDKLDIPQKQRETNFEVIRFLLEHGASPLKTNLRKEDGPSLIAKSPYQRLLKQILEETQLKFVHPNVKLLKNRKKIPKIRQELDRSIDKQETISKKFLCFKLCF